MVSDRDKNGSLPPSMGGDVSCDAPPLDRSCPRSAVFEQERDQSFSIAFIGWNPFQLLHVASIARQLPGSGYILEKRKHNIGQFVAEYLDDIHIPTIIWPARHIAILDGKVDAFVCQTPFSQMDLIERTPIIMIQYGYAKEVHNYGPWRSRASLCLVYGDYAARKLEPMCPVEVIGNPALESWHDEGHAVRCRHALGTRLCPDKPTLLYAPTWGPLSTWDLFSHEIFRLSAQFNVLLKLHHNTDMLDRQRKKGLSDDVLTFGANDRLVDLLPVADVVLSDYSGGIFDAVYCETPVILLQDDIRSKIGNKLSYESLEYARREDIGPVVRRPDDLENVIRGVLSGAIDYREKNRHLSRELYRRAPGASDRAATAISQFLNTSRRFL